MTTSNPEKVLKQIGNKKGKYAKWKKHSTIKPRTYGDVTKKCKLCGRTGGHISKYKIDLCRHCFRQFALDLGFKKYS